MGPPGGGCPAGGRGGKPPLLERLHFGGPRRRRPPHHGDVAWLLTDFRYQLWARQEAPDFEVLVYQESLADTLAELLGKLAVESLGFEAAHVTFRQDQCLTQATAAVGLDLKWQPLEGLIEGLREVKTTSELVAIRCGSAGLRGIRIPCLTLWCTWCSMGTIWRRG